MNLKQVAEQANSFLSQVFTQLDQVQFTLEKHWHIDHLCYRTSTEEEYRATKKTFENFSQLLIESEVNGRLISTFKLEKPLVHRGWQIDLIELPAPKNGKITPSGFEHFEVVCDLPFDELKRRYSGFTFSESGLKKDFNQELEISFDSFAVKFHHLSLESVIHLEANEPVFSALKKSNVLIDLKHLSPVVAGTFPLNINVAGSDIDVLICGNNLREMKSLLIQKYGSWMNFQCREMSVQGEETILSSFSFQGIDFEIFGQKKPSIQQTGYLHFLIEERLLKIGGPIFQNQIKTAREQGLKTEPAFAQVLGLQGDPYQQLLLLQRKTHEELSALFAFVEPPLAR